ncbi:L-threo-3-deoxy-hexylosonate aldolase [Talaromyces pinophilus]|nr:L-threo-3-deoxy-hexylosonate aldolase [Talaromyces pinophilus]
MGSVSKTGTPYPPGIHVPSLTWFKSDETQSIDWDIQQKHLEFLISSGLPGVVICGTNGEAAAVTPQEKSKLISLARSIAQNLGRPELAITCGTFGGCTQAIIDDTKIAAEAGADFALVLVPSFFHFALGQDAIIGFFQEVASASPIPIVIYNFPGVVSGLNVNSEMLQILGDHPNIVAVKLTCGTIASVARTVAKFGPGLDLKDNKYAGQPQFVALAGQSDWLVPALSVGGTGCVTGMANLYPKTCIEIFNLFVAGKKAEAEELQIKLASVEWGFGKGGINGTKWVVGKFLGYPEESTWCRRPYPKFLDNGKREWIETTVKPLEEVEAALVKRG